MTNISQIKAANLIVKPNPHSKYVVDFVIPNMLPRGYVTIIAGEPKSGKTWLIMRLATELTVGGTILDGFATGVSPQKILFLEGDIGHSLFNSRLKQTGWAYDSNLIDLVFQEHLMRCNINCDLASKDGQEFLHQLISKQNPNVVFIDSLTSFHGADENSNKEMRSVISALHSMANKTNTAIVVVHHTRKPKKSEENCELSQNDIVGAGVIQRLSGNMIGVKRLKGEDDNDIYVVSSLASWFNKFPTFTFTITEDDTYNIPKVEMKVDLEPDLNGGSKRSLIWKIIKEYFGNGNEFSRKDIESKIDFRISAVYLKKLLNEWVKQGRLIKKGYTKNTRYCIATEVRNKYTNKTSTPVNPGYNKHTPTVYFNDTSIDEIPDIDYNDENLEMPEWYNDEVQIIETLDRIYDELVYDELAALDVSNQNKHEYINEINEYQEPNGDWYTETLSPIRYDYNHPIFSNQNPNRDPNEPLLWDEPEEPEDINNKSDDDIKIVVENDRVIMVIPEWLNPPKRLDSCND